MIPRVSIAVLATVLASGLAGPALAHDTDNEPTIYRLAIKTILDHEKPTRFAIWNQTITAEVFASARVPRQSPTFQFVRTLPGVTPGLELSLLYANLRSRNLSGEYQDRRLPSFDGLPSGTEFAGFLASSALQQEQSGERPIDANSPLLAVGFSRVGFDQKQRNALVYAEICSVAPAAICGGEGFLFVVHGGEWQLKAHSFLWQGVSGSFWTQ